VKVTVSAVLPVDIDTAWEMLHAPAVFRAVSSPFTIFREHPEHPLPKRFSPDTDYTVSVLAGGIIPMGTQVIRLSDSVQSWKSRETVDRGHGVRGMLGFLRNWNHRMRVEALPHGHTRFDDQLTVDASWLTPALWPAMWVLWRWRAWMLRRVAKKNRSPLSDSWESRYLSKGQMWSGKVNPWVQDVAQGIPPGRALDLGCGEGADALWLAEKGWQVDAVDASAVAIFRAVDEEHRRELSASTDHTVSWTVADLAAWTCDAEAYDFVSLQFMHLPANDRDALWNQAIAAVAPGGTLLIVGHSPADETLGIPRPPAPLLFTTDTLSAHRPSGWSHWSATERERVVEGQSGHMTVTDVVLVATR